MRFFQAHQVNYIPSVANFVTVLLPVEGHVLFDRMQRQGVIVRPLKGFGIPNAIRITVGKPQENELFAEVFLKCADRPGRRAGMKRLTIAIDGPSSSGKSTLGKRLARHFGYLFIDTGAMYRAVGLEGPAGGRPAGRRRAAGGGGAGDPLRGAAAPARRRSCGWTART